MVATAYEDYIAHCYSSRTWRPIDSQFEEIYSPITFNFNNSGIFERYMVIDLTKDILEIPCIYKYMVCTQLAKNSLAITRDKTEDVVNTLKIPMFILKECPEVCKSANPLLKEFFRDTYNGSLLCKKKASDTIYIGGEGIIMYEDFTPLLMFTLEVKRTVTNSTKYIPLRRILRINPLIYNESDIIAKHIRTTMLSKIFPMKGRHFRFFRNYSGVLTTDTFDWDFKVIIEDFSNFFQKPNIPDCSFDSSNVNKFLSEHIDDIIGNEIIR